MLENYTSLQTVLLVKIVCSKYKMYPEDEFHEETLMFSDGGLRNYTYGTDTYIGLGNLVGISSTSSELKSSSGELTITISGVPNTSLFEIINSKIKGSSVQIYRAYYNSMTGEPITVGPLGNVSSRFKGFINNYSIEEEYDTLNRTASSTVVFTCSSAIDVIQNRHSGRRTNQASQQKYFPNDVSMNRVATLENAYFDFGKKKA